MSENCLVGNSIALDREPEVRLTKYNTLNVNSHPKGSLKCSSHTQLNEFNDHLDLGADNKEHTWLSVDEKQFRMSNDSEMGNNIVGEQISTIADREQFVIIWTRLSFQVNLSLYDRFVNRLGAAFNGIRSTQDKLKRKQDNLNAINSRDQLCKSSSNYLRQLSRFQKEIKTDTKRTIFENLNGFIKSGEISAILGPSGIGKTSLLNAICGKVENYRGRIQLIGGGSHNLRLSIIPQKDYLIDNLTVKETLLYSSKILNSEKEFDHETHILNVVGMLNLADCFESSVSNISGGEYKRVSIAQGLLKQPDLLVLDEPTSGLDSLNCKNLIKSLAQLIDASRKGHINPIAIVMTIHQPDIEIFHMFDHVYCMARKGRVIYDGQPSEVMEVLSNQLKGSPKYEEALRSGHNFAVNPATLLIEIASENIYGQEIIEKLAEHQRAKFELELCEMNNKRNTQSEHSHEQLVTNQSSKQWSFADLNVKSSPVSSVGRISCKKDNLSIYKSASCDNASSQNEEQLKEQFFSDKRLNSKNDNHGKFFHHTKILAKRAFKSTIRDSLMTAVAFVFHLSIPFTMWLVYSERIGDVKACPIVQNDVEVISLISNSMLKKMNLLKDDMIVAIECQVMTFLTTYSFSLCSLTIAALAFPLNMHILLKEVKNGWYNLPSFVVGKTIANFPFEVLFPVCSQMLAYVLLGMPQSYLEWRFWLSALVMTLISIISHTLGLIFGAIFMDSVETSIFMAVASTLPLVLMSGFSARIRTMPKLLQYLSWFSPYLYSANALNIIRFGYGICPCNDSTEEYLESTQPNFTDIPESIKSLFTYYITNTAQDPRKTTTESVSTLESIIHSSRDLIKNSTLNGTITTFGVSNELTISEIERSELISNIEANQIDPFKRLAHLVIKSFTFGRELNSCDTVRSEILGMNEALPDSSLPYLFLGMLMLIISLKITLFIIVKGRLGMRI